MHHLQNMRLSELLSLHDDDESHVSGIKWHLL